MGLGGMDANEWDIYNLEGETNVERLKDITAELSSLRAMRARYLGTDYEPVEAVVDGHAEWLWRKIEPAPESLMFRDIECDTCGGRCTWVPPRPNDHP